MYGSLSEITREYVPYVTMFDLCLLRPCMAVYVYIWLSVVVLLCYQDWLCVALNSCHWAAFSF